MRVETQEAAAVEKYTGLIEDIKWDEIAEITTDVQAGEIAAVMNQAGRIVDEIEKTRLTITRPLDEAKKNIMTVFKNLAHRPEVIVAEAKLLLRKYDDKKRAEQEKARRVAEAEAERERQKLLKRAEKVKTPEKAEELREQAELITAPVIAETKIDGVQYTENWTAEIVDASLIPYAYMTPDLKKIYATVKAMKEQTAIPGVRAVCVKVVKNMKGGGL